MNKKPDPLNLIEFPCEYILKVMGKADSPFKERALNIVCRHFPNVDLSNMSERTSKDSTYLALTVIVHAESKDQLNRLYLELTDCPDVLMSL